MPLLLRLLTLHKIITTAGILGLIHLSECSYPDRQILIDATALDALSKTTQDDIANIHCGVFPFSLLCQPNLSDQINHSEILTKNSAWGDLVLKSGDFNKVFFSYLSLWKNVAAFHPSIATVFSGLPISVTKALADTCDRLTLQVLINKFPQTLILSGTNVRLYHERRDFTNIAFADHINNILTRKSQKEIRESKLLLAERMLMQNKSTADQIYPNESPETVCEFLAGFGLGNRSIANLCMYAGFLGYDDACRTAIRFVSSRQDEPPRQTVWNAMSPRNRDSLIAYVDAGLSRVRHSPADVCRAFPAACLQAAAILELPRDPELFVGLMRSIATALRKRMDVA